MPFKYALLMVTQIPFKSDMKNFHQTLSAHFRFFRYNDQKLNTSLLKATSEMLSVFINRQTCLA